MMNIYIVVRYRMLDGNNPIIEEICEAFTTENDAEIERKQLDRMFNNDNLWHEVIEVFLNDDWWNNNE